MYSRKQLCYRILKKIEETAFSLLTSRKDVALGNFRRRFLLCLCFYSFFLFGVDLGWVVGNGCCTAWSFTRTYQISSFAPPRGYQYTCRSNIRLIYSVTRGSKAHITIGTRVFVQWLQRNEAHQLGSTHTRVSCTFFFRRYHNIVAMCLLNLRTPSKSKYKYCNWQLK